MGEATDTLQSPQRERPMPAPALLAKRFQEILEGFPDAVVVLSSRGRIYAANSEALRVFGYDAGELLGQGLEVLVPEAEHELDDFLGVEFARDEATGPERLDRGLHGRRKDGSTLAVDVSLGRVQTDHGQMLIVTMADLTQRNAGEARADFLASLVESSTDAIIGKDLGGLIRTWNAGAERLFGFVAAEVIGRPTTMIIPADRTQEVADLRDRVLGGQSLGGVETVRQAKDGRQIAVSVTASPVMDQDDEIVGTSVIIRDCTEVNRAAELVRRSEARFRAIFAAGGEAMLIFDAKGRYSDANDAAVALFGYSVAEFVGKRLGLISTGVAPYNEAAAAAHFQDTADPEGRVPVDWQFKAKDGRLIWGKVQYRSVSLGGEVSYIVMIRDFTETRAMEQALRQSQKMEAIGQLTGGIAHDFNNLLAVIQGNLELIGEKIHGDAELRDITGDALAAADRGASLVRQLLAYARKQPLAPQVFRVDSVLSSITRMAQRTLGAAIEVRTVLPPAPWSVRADPHQLENALLNLAVNARDAMSGGGKLTFETANREVDETHRVGKGDIRPGRYVKICVTDTGVGIPADSLDRVLEPFYTTKPAGAGTGLGLSMVYGFVKQSGGHLNIYSEVGVGTTVSLYLPAAETSEMSATLASPRAIAISGGEVVLVLEDNDMVRKFAVRVLEGLGYRTLEAADGAAALTILEAETRVDLLLTDVVLPDRLDGPTVAGRALAVRPELKVLFMTGYAPEAAGQNGLLHPGAQMLSKPFLKSELAAKVRDILGA